MGYYGRGVKLVSCQAHSVSSLEMLMLLTSNYSHSSVRSEQAWASLQSLQNFSFSSQYMLLMTNYKSGKEMRFQMRHSAWEISIHFATAPIKELGNVLIYMGLCWHCRDDRWYLANQIKSKRDFFKGIWRIVPALMHVVYLQMYPRFPPLMTNFQVTQL